MEKRITEDQIDEIGWRASEITRLRKLVAKGSRVDPKDNLLLLDELMYADKCELLPLVVPHLKERINNHEIKLNQLLYGNNEKASGKDPHNSSQEHQSNENSCNQESCGTSPQECTKQDCTCNQECSNSETRSIPDSGNVHTQNQCAGSDQNETREVSEEQSEGDSSSNS